jgi:hypothetical protein
MVRKDLTPSSEGGQAEEAMADWGVLGAGEVLVAPCLLVLVQ